MNSNPQRRIEALKGCRVLDISNSVSGQYCARLMADAGADVILIEPPTGVASRYTGPFWPEANRPDDSIGFWHLNSSKRSMTLDWRGPTGSNLLTEILRSADVIVTSLSTMDSETLVEDGSSTVICRVEDFDSTGPYGRWQGSELIHQAMAGTMIENGEAGREPLFGVGHRSSYAAGTVAYISVLAQLLAGSGGRRSRTTVSETAAAMSYNRATQHWYSGKQDPRGDPFTPRMTLRCKDGWIVAFPTQTRWRVTCTVFRAPELLDHPDLADEPGRLANWRLIESAFQAGVSEIACSEVIADAQRARVVAARVASPEDLWADAHLRQRGYWQHADDGESRRPALGPVFRFGDGQKRHADRPPRLGENTMELLEPLGISPDEYELLRNSGVA